MNFVWITIFFLLLMSAFFSGMEIAYVTSNKLKLELDKTRDNLTGKILRKITESPGDFITTMLVGNNIALVLYGIYSADIITRYLKEIYPNLSPMPTLLVQTALSGIVILILAEFLPKIFFQMYANTLLRKFSFLIYAVYMIFRPVSWIIMKLSNFLLRLFTKDFHNISELSLTKTEMQKYLSQQADSHPAGENEETEVKIFSNALKFSDLKARDIMVPRMDIVAVDIDAPFEELKKAFLNSGHSKILVYEDTIDNIKGYIHFFDLLKKNTHIKKLLRRVLMVPETMPIDELLKKMTSSKKSIAVVFGEYGGTSGLITLEDIMEKIFGEIEDEHDKEEAYNKQLDENTFLFSAKMNIHDINEKYRLNLPEKEDYESLGGYVLELFGKIPSTGEKIEDEDFIYIVEKATDKNVEFIKVIRKDR